MEGNKNENTYNDETSSADDCEPLLHSPKMFKKYNYITPNSQQYLDEDTASPHSFHHPETAVNTAVQDYKVNEQEGIGDKDNGDDVKDNEDDDKDNKDDENDEDNTNLDHEDHDNTANVDTNIDMAVLMHAVQKLSRESDERKTVTFLDFAGQSAYYAFHQIYLSPETFSILVVDMTKNLKHVCETTGGHGRFKSWTYEGNKILTTTYMYM